jgi:C_GCAxxG_C_C family probable redox protein
MDRIQQAEQRFSEGYACSQAIFSTYCEAFDLDPKIALGLSAGLGGGICMGKTCGAVTGAILVLGLFMAESNPETNEGRKKIKQSVIAYLDTFKKMNGSTECEHLLSTNISTPEGMQFALDNNLFTTICPKFINDSSAILEELLK